MLPTKFIPVLQSNFKGVLKLQIVPILDVLQFSYSIYGIKYITESVIQSLYANPSNENLFNSLDKELFIKYDIGLIGTEQLLLYLKNKLTTLDSQSTELFQTIFPTANGKQIQIFLSYYQIYSTTLFVEQFVTSYEIFRINLISQAIQPVIEQPQIAKPEPMMQIETESESEQIMEMDETQDNDMLSLFNDSFKISPNNICSYFISKQICNKLVNLQNSVPVEVSGDNHITVKIIPLIDGSVITSKAFNQEILNILYSFDFSKEEYLSKLKLLIQQLTYVISYYLEADDKDLAKENVIFSLQIIYFLILLYSCKFTEQNRFTKEQVNQCIQYIMLNHLDQSKLKYYSISFDLLSQEETLPFKKVNDQIDQLLTKERYMLDIDRDLYIRNVMEKLDDEYSAVQKKQIKLKLNNPTTLNIEKLLNKTSIGYLGYELQKPNQKQFETNKIITKEYYDILLISTIPKLSRKTIENELNQICIKYADMILNLIFKELSSSINTDTIISTLYLLEYQIRPFLKSEATIETELFLLYRIVIPYLYDVYGITDYVDYFH